jgi:hypothetical protein
VIWREEFGLQKPKDTEVAGYFEISRTAAQRVKTVAQLDPDLSRKIINAKRRPADEVVYIIANRPPEVQPEAYERYGHLTVATARKLLQQQESSRPAVPLTGAGRPRNFVLPQSNLEECSVRVSIACTEVPS